MYVIIKELWFVYDLNVTREIFDVDVVSVCFHLHGVVMSACALLCIFAFCKRIGVIWLLLW